MKTANQLFSNLIVLLLLFSTSTIFAQDEDAPKRPEYVVVTKMYWSKNYEGTPEEWRATEKEFKEKILSKNEYIMGSGLYTHLFTENSNEVLFVQTYPSWEAIDKAADRNGELAKEAFPDEEARKAFYKKRNSAYSNYHSDEIYATLPGVKVPSAKMEKDMVLYIRLNKLAFPKDGSFEEWDALNKKLLENVINKNDFIKAYYPSMHAWGSDKRDYVEAIIIESMADLDKMFEKNRELMKEAFTEEEGKALGKYFKGHGDYLYTAIKL